VSDVGDPVADGPWTPEKHAAHQEYGERLQECRTYEGLAGGMLLQALQKERRGEDGSTSRRLAEDFAAKALGHDDWCREWRLANGYPA
jgi:hypothetical protein